MSEKSKSDKKVNGLASFIQSNLDKIYTSTHYTDPTNAKDLEMIRGKISQSIKSITDNNMNTIGEPNISKLFGRLADSQQDKDLIKGIEDVFSDNALMSNVSTSYVENKWMIDLDSEIDATVKYMPKLLEALDTRKENVLSSDHFSKDFVNIVNSSDVFDESFNSKVKDLKEEYDLASLFDAVYDEAAKYGEQFIYIVPYDKAINKLINIPNPISTSKMNLESSMIVSDNDDSFGMERYANTILKDGITSINLEINTSNLLINVVSEAKLARSKLNKVYNESMQAGFIQSLNEAKKHENEVDITVGGTTKLKGTKFNKTIEDELSFAGFSDLDDSVGSQDGLISKKENKISKMNGCIVKCLPRAQVIPVYIDDLCLGYYYVEFSDMEMFNSMRANTSLSSSTNASKMMQQTAIDNSRSEDMLKYISSQLSKFIDSKFINANQDYKKEIYMILKHNDLYNNPNQKIRVSFIPPEDMVHVFFKMDKKTHHGISDLDRALLPAKLYTSLYLTNIIAQMTRGQDKRVYYIKQNVETNIAKTMLNTINQIKKGNFNIRQVENMNNVLNVIGRFNDFVIPMNSSGDAPIQFEVMPESILL